SNSSTTSQNSASGNLVQGNYIGTDASGTTALGNSFGGIFINTGPSNNTIGGTAGNTGNKIAFNLQGGVIMDFDSGPGNSIISNSIFSNDSLGIDLGLNGV